MPRTTASKRRKFLRICAHRILHTDARGDDVMAKFSSRSPTRSFTTGQDGVSYYDNVIKPDIVAPGNKIFSAESTSNLLTTEAPTLETGLVTLSGTSIGKLMCLSGTSISTPIVAGAAALIFQLRADASATAYCSATAY
ncbi:MAG: S8 family serine peptidase [Pyrinomonadaceae bacterium]